MKEKKKMKKIKTKMKQLEEIIPESETVADEAIPEEEFVPAEISCDLAPVETEKVEEINESVCDESEPEEKEEGACEEAAEPQPEEKASENDILIEEVRNQTKVLKSLRVILIILLIVLAVAGWYVIQLSNSITSIVQNVSKVTETANEFIGKLNEIDFSGLGEISGILEDSAQGISDALAKLNNIDIDSLNKAIKDLGGVVTPLARLFGR